MNERKVNPEKDQKLLMMKFSSEEFLSELYTTHREGFLAWMVKSFRCSLDDAKEVYQNTFLTFIQKCASGQLRLTSSIKTYLYGIGKKKYLKLKEKENKPKPPLQQTEPFEPGREVSELARYHLNALGEPCRTLLELYYFRGFSMEAIAENMQFKNTDVAKTKRYKCIQKLKQNILKNNTLEDFYP